MHISKSYTTRHHGNTVKENIREAWLTLSIHEMYQYMIKVLIGTHVLVPEHTSVVILLLKSGLTVTVET